MPKTLSSIIKKIKYSMAAVVATMLLIYLLAINIKSSEATTSQTITDANDDGVINLVDTRILAPPGSVSCPVCVDVNGDKIIDQKDIAIISSKAELAASAEQAVQPGEATQSAQIDQYSFKSRYDVNNDGALNESDVNIVQSYVGQKVNSPLFGLDDPSELTSGFVAGDLLVRFKSGTTDQQKQELYAKYNLSFKSSLNLLPISHLGSSESNVENLQKQIKGESIVENVSKNHVWELLTNDPNWSNQWGHQKIGIEYTWFLDTHGATGTTGIGSVPIRVAVIDSGADYSHPDLQQNLSYRLRHNILNQNNTGFQDEDVTDQHGHGTHMTGIIGATANNVVAIAGLNWAVEIIPVASCLGPLGYCSDISIERGLEWLAFLPDEQKPQVVNMSVGLNSHSQNASPDISYYMDLLKDNYNVIFVVAAGNSGDQDCLFPANRPGIICVGSTDQNDALAVATSGTRDADILAPGVDIISTTPPDSTIDTNHNGIQELNIDNIAGGTSMAAAHVSGVTALCLMVAPEQTRWNLKCNNYKHNGFGRIDSFATVWYKNCKRFDHNNNYYVGPGDQDSVKNRMNNASLYNQDYDVFPNGRDGVIDERDYFVQATMTGASCRF